MPPLAALAGAILVAAALVAAPPVAARNHSELRWRTIRTEHFHVHFHQGTERTARRAAAIAEEIYPAVTDLYGHRPKPPTHLIIRDTDDYANGAAYYYDDKIEIWATALEFELRGTHNWLRDVITHEFTHIVSLQAAARLPHRVPAVYVQGFGYETERRPDVLIGYPNVLVSYPVAGTNASAWWAEGVAQYQTAKVYNDWWDTHRDMLLRAAVLEDKLLTYEQMGNLDKNGLEAELVYNQGNSLVRWIAASHGEEALREIARGLTRFWQLTENGAFRRATGKNAAELYRDWKAEMERAYGELRASIEPHAIRGEAVSDDGYLNIFPRFRPGTRELYWASNRGQDFGSLELVRRTLGSDGEAGSARLDDIEDLVGGIGTPVVFSSDGKRGYYSKRVERNRYGSRVFDVYVLDLETEEEDRLTHDLRAKDPCPSPDGSWIVAVLNGDGTNELVLLGPDGAPGRALTADSPHGTQFYQPAWSPDGRELLYATYEGLSRDIAVMEVASGAVRYLARSAADERDPAFVPGENAIVYASDRSGIFNIYRQDLATGAVTQVTNVLGGAFYPSVAVDGTLAYAAYTAAGYEVRTLAPGDWGTTPVELEPPPEPRGDYRLAAAGAGALGLAGGRFHRGEAQGYVEAFAGTQIMPRLVIDNGRPRLGLYLASREILDRHAIFGGAAVGRRFDGFEFELFALYENRMTPVTLFGEAFRVRRRSEDTVDAKILGDRNHVGQIRPVANELRYDLVEVDVGGRYEWGPPFSFSSWKDLSLYYVHQDYNINLFATDALDGSFYGKDGWNYYIGDAVHARFDYRSVGRAVDAEINPRGGRQIMVRGAHNWARLNPSGARDISDRSFQPVFESNNFLEAEFDWREYVGLPWGRHALELRLRGAAIDRVETDDFFHFPVGSRPGLRGYSFYSRQGRKLGLAAVTYRFPIVERIDRRLLALVMHRLYGGVFAEVGNAWSDDGLEGLSAGRLLTDAGFELRLENTSFYALPAAFYVEGAYGFDRVVNTENQILSGEEWRWYVGMLFGY